MHSCEYDNDYLESIKKANFCIIQTAISLSRNTLLHAAVKVLYMKSDPESQNIRLFLYNSEYILAMLTLGWY